MLRVAVLLTLGVCVDLLHPSPLLAQDVAAALPYGRLVEDAASRHRVDPLLVHAVIAVESQHRSDAVSPAGAQGLMQLMPGPARMFGLADPWQCETGRSCLTGAVLWFC